MVIGSSPPRALGEPHSGDREVIPDEDDKTRMLNSSVSRVRTVVKFCVDEDGAVGAPTTIVASPLANWDERARRKVQSWRFDPYLIDGKPTFVCSAIQFLYAQR